jgi:hypothetical protein
MTSGHANDPLLRALARLPEAAPNDARASRVRERCHAALERSRLRSGRAARPATIARAIEAALVGGLCLLYLSTVLLEAARLLVR